MNVWVVTSETDDEGYWPEIEYVASSNKKAEDYIDKQIQEHRRPKRDFAVELWTVDEEI